MHRADKAVLRLAIGIGLAVLIAYGLALRLPFVACMMTVLLLCKPGPPIPFVKGVVLAAASSGACWLAGVLMVPILEHYAVDRRRADRRLALRGVLRRRAPRQSADGHPGDRLRPRSRWPASRNRPWPRRSLRPWPWGSVSGSWSAASRTRSFLTLPGLPARRRRRPRSAPAAAHRAALQATLVVMPVFVLALTNPALYLAAIMKTGGAGPAGRRRPTPVRPDANWSAPR